MSIIYIDGKAYTVIERLPYHPQGMEARVVSDPASEMKERIAVKCGGKWRWWTSSDRLGLKLK